MSIEKYLSDDWFENGEIDDENQTRILREPEEELDEHAIEKLVAHQTFISLLRRFGADSDWLRKVSPFFEG